MSHPRALAAVLIAAALCGGVLAVAAPHAAQSTTYMCPMHPDVRGAAGDACPKCGMALVPATTDATPWALDVDVTPRAVRPGEPARVRFAARNPITGATARRFEVVHDRVFHLFVVGRDLGYFAHIHPQLRGNGELTVDVTVPRAGAYMLIADFLPEGGAPQFVQRALVTAGYTGSLAAVAHPAPDLADKTDGAVRAHLVPPDPRAQREQLLTFELRDPASGAPITDAEPYLGAV